MHGLRAGHQIDALIWLLRRLRRANLIADIITLLCSPELFLAGVLRNDRRVPLRELRRRLSAPCRKLLMSAPH